MCLLRRGRINLLVIHYLESRSDRGLYHLLETEERERIAVQLGVSIIGSETCCSDSSFPCQEAAGRGTELWVRGWNVASTAELEQ
jgi:hypothetical protein